MSVRPAIARRDLLKGAGYNWGGVETVDDSFFDNFRVYLQSIKFDFNNYNG